MKLLQGERVYCWNTKSNGKEQKVKFKNLASGKEVADFKNGDILIMKDRQTGEAVVYMVARQYNRYNLINLHNGIMFSANFTPFDHMQKGIRKWFDLIGVIENEHLELSME